MKENQISLREWIKQFDTGAFESPDSDTQIKAGWYDWFCKEQSLRNKTRVLGKKVKQIAKSTKVDPDKHYVFFKNNCPMNGSLYDDFRICSLETGNVAYCIIPRYGHKTFNGEAHVYGRDNDFKEALVKGTWRDVKRFFGV